MKPQNLFEKYISIYRFHSAYGAREGLKRVWSIFRELDLYDFRRGVNTRTIKVVALEKSTYMPYWPAFTSVVNEMIKFSYNYYVSAIRYSDLNRKTIFVDFAFRAISLLNVSIEMWLYHKLLFLNIKICYLTS